MKTFGIEELAEMADCRSALEDVLIRLDGIGAGIAAIHVDAAIEQLQANMSSAAAQSGIGAPAKSDKSKLPDKYVVPPTRH